MIVADASLITNALTDSGPVGDTARTAMAEQEIAIPDSADVEVVAAVRGLWLGKAISASQFSAAVDDLMALPVDRFPVRALMKRTYELRANVSTYDAAYVALAERLGCTLVTFDRRLARASGPRCPIDVLS